MAKKKVEMIEVVVVTKFFDKEDNKKLRKVGEVFEVTEKRYEEIVAAGEKAGVVYVEIPKPETAEQPETAEEGE